MCVDETVYHMVPQKCSTLIHVMAFESRVRDVQNDTSALPQKCQSYDSRNVPSVTTASYLQSSFKKKLIQQLVSPLSGILIYFLATLSTKQSTWKKNRK